MGLRPTTKKVNGRWYDINQAADRIAQLEQQVEALEAARFAYASEFDGDKESIHENIRKMKQQVEALSEKYSDLIMQVQVKIPNETRHETARRIIQQHESRKSATAQQEGE